jgi:hypothetical protein
MRLLDHPQRRTIHDVLPRLESVEDAIVSVHILFCYNRLHALHATIRNLATDVAERWVPEVVRKRGGLHDIRIDAPQLVRLSVHGEAFCQPPTDLGDLHTMRHPIVGELQLRTR